MSFALMRDIRCLLIFSTYKCGVPEKAGPVPLAFDLFMQIRPSKYIGERRSYDPVEGTFPVVTGFTVFL